MPIVRSLVLVVASAVVVGCSNDANVPTPTGGAGVELSITAIQRAGDGYTLNYTLQNRDTADVTFPGCAASAQALRGGNWVSVTPAIPCYLAIYDLAPGHRTSGSVAARNVAPGESLRVVLGWSYLSGTEQKLAESDSSVVSN